MNDWIRHCDAKAGVILAFTGAMGTILFKLVEIASKEPDRSPVFDALATLATALLVLAAGFCAFTLTPRIDDAEADPETFSHLFFGSIATKYRNTRAEYGQALAALTADPDGLTKDLAEQIHANARIATVKAVAARRAVRVAILAGGTIAMIATLIGITSLQE